jgi:hypothetical protein
MSSAQPSHQAGSVSATPVMVHCCSCCSRSALLPAPVSGNCSSVTTLVRYAAVQGYSQRLWLRLLSQTPSVQPAGQHRPSLNPYQAGNIRATPAIVHCCRCCSRSALLPDPVSGNCSSVTTLVRSMLLYRGTVSACGWGCGAPSASHVKVSTGAGATKGESCRTGTYTNSGMQVVIVDRHNAPMQPGCMQR